MLSKQQRDALGQASELVEKANRVITEAHLPANVTSENLTEALAVAAKVLSELRRRFTQLEEIKSQGRLVSSL